MLNCVLPIFLRFFAFSECVKFDSNCPYIDALILTPNLTPFIMVLNGLKRSKVVKTYIFKFCEVPKTLDFQHFSQVD